MHPAKENQKSLQREIHSFPPAQYVTWWSHCPWKHSTKGTDVALRNMEYGTTGGRQMVGLGGLRGLFQSW